MKAKPVASAMRKIREPTFTCAGRLVWDAGEPVVGTPKNGLQRDVTMPPDIVDWSESISMRSSNQVQKPCSSTQPATPADRLDRTPSAGIG